MLTDSAARTIATDGWANQSTGHVEAPTGAFSLIIIEPNEIAEIQAAFGLTDEDVTAGYHVEMQDSQGNTHVFEFPTAAAAREMYADLERQFDEWAGSDEEEPDGEAGAGEQ